MIRLGISEAPRASRVCDLLIAAVALALVTCVASGCSEETKSQGSGIRGSAERVKGDFSVRVPGALIQVVDPDSHELLASTHTEADGTFEIVIAPGRYLIVWRDPGPPGGDGPDTTGDPYLDSVAHADATVVEGQFASVELVQPVK
jgi:hypothetical protein